MTDKLTNRERLQQITTSIEQGIQDLFESEKYMRYLSVMSRFHRYSVNNTMFIYMQKPDATLVAGYNKCKNQFERHVKMGEHGITIIASTPLKKKIEEQKLDPDTKAPMLDAEGKVIMEKREVKWINPKFCVNSNCDANRAKYIQGGSRKFSCCLVYNIPPIGLDVKGRS